MASNHYNLMHTTESENQASRSHQPQIAYAPVINIESVSLNTLACVNCYATQHGGNSDSTTFRRENVQHSVVLPESHSRPSDLVVAMTMYNESPEDLKRTMKGIVENLTDLQSTDTIDSQRVTIALVADGEDRVNPRTKAWLQRHGYFDANNRDYLSGTEATMHFFTSMHKIKQPVTHQNPHGGVVEVRFVYLLKKKNAKKLDSHAWILEGLAPMLCPNHVVFLDVGTQPKKTAIRMLVQEMESDHRVAGCCGEITIDAPYQRAFQQYLSPVILAQHFEYKMANSLDKSFESMFGFVSVLPGAFCAFRMGPWTSESSNGGRNRVFVDNGPLSCRPMAQYLLPLTRTEQDGYDSLGPFNKNMYLAEDRVLCFELVAKKNEANLLRYVKGAVAETDPMDSLSGLISQRRRWLNGSLFAKIYAMMEFGKMSQTVHTRGQMFAFVVQFFFYAIQLVMDWFSVSLFFIQFRVATDLCLGNTETSPIFSSDANLQPISVALQFLYMAVIVLLMLLSISGAKPKDTVWSHRFAFLVFGLLSYGTIILTSAYIMLGGSLFLKVLLLTSLSTYFIVGLVHGELHHVVLTILPYLFALPSFVNIFQIYSMSNLHDVSWGTRPEVPESSTQCSTDEEQGYGTATPVAVRGGVYTDLNDFMGSLNEGTDDEESSHSSSCCCSYRGGGSEGATDPISVAEMQQDAQRNFMLKTMALWLVSNLMLVLITSTSYAVVPQVDFMNFTMGVLFSSMMIRLFGSTTYACSRYGKRKSPWWSCCHA